MRIAIDGLKFMGIVALSALIFTWLGVYNTNEMPFWFGFVFWAVTIATGSLVASMLAPLLWDGDRKSWPAALKIGLMAAIVSVPITIELVLFGYGYSNGLAHPVSVWALQYAYVFVISAVLTSLMYVRSVYDNQIDDLTNGEDVADSVETFMERLPVKYRGAALYAVSSEDHYLRVHTDRGEELILMRLADALRELAGADGLQTHRSWWVAKDGVEDSRRENGKLVLMLKSGGSAAVSRTFQPAVKQAGLA